MGASVTDVRFTPNSGHSRRQSKCPLSAKSGHSSRKYQPAPNGFFPFLKFAERIPILPSASTGTHAGGYLAGEGAWGKSIPGGAKGRRLESCSAVVSGETRTAALYYKSPDFSERACLLTVPSQATVKSSMSKKSSPTNF